MKEKLELALLSKTGLLITLLVLLSIGTTLSFSDSSTIAFLESMKASDIFEKIVAATKEELPAKGVNLVNNPVYLPALLDSPRIDTTSPYPIQDNLNPFARPKNPFDFGNPSNVTRSIDYDPVSKRYVLRETVGGRLVRPPTYMTFEEYMEYESKQSKKDYFEKKSNLASEALGESNRDSEGGLIPKIFVGPKVFDKIFGGSTIDIRPQGSAELRFAGNFIRNDNPALNIQQRRIGNFDFNMDIQMNVVGNIGDKLKFTANQNTAAVFNFENQMKLDYAGKEDEIIKKIEAGNVTLPLRSSLIQGSQSLFGIKTELQFGRLRITTVLSQQQGRAQNIQVQNGAQTTMFDLGVEQYDMNRHFFLTQFFRDNFNRAMDNLPVIRSNTQITRVEVWVTNRNNVSAEVRDVCGFMDLGEPRPFNRSLLNNSPNTTFPDNDVNDLLERLYQFPPQGLDSLRNSNFTLDVLATRMSEFRNTVDYEKVFARKLQPTEYTFHPLLGYISLNQTLNNDEVLAVAFEYTINGIPYRVGEFSQDLPNDQIRPQVIFLKMLKSTALRVDLPTWDLMMKNIYSLNTFQLSNKDFMLNIAYQDLANGYMNFVPEGSIRGRQLIQVLGLDNLNVQLEPQPDGFFDYIENVTVNSQNGRIIFPKLEPFGADLKDAFVKAGADTIIDKDIIEKYMFQELYDSTRAWAVQFPEKNRFRLRGRFQASSGSEINLGAFNLPPGSVKVTAGGRPLMEGSDYRVDYNMGRVQILNTSLLNSAEPINVSFENNPMFQMNQRTLSATRFDYLVSKKFNLGGTFIHLNERPITQKVNLGEEPISNSIVGVDFNYNSQSRFVTRMVDKLPFINTKEISTVTLNGEFAQLIPGSSKAIRGDENGISYIDDFEGSENAVDIRLFGAWSLASVPSKFPESELRNDLRSGFNRAHLSWYTIDPLFFRQSSITPNHIRDNVEMRSNHYMREILEQEVFPNRQLANNQPLNIPTLDLAYFPRERGSYNYEILPTATSAGINADGFLNNPRSRWAGIQRRIETNDFEAANVEFIEFWMMDPYIYNPNHTGGDLFINLGSVSEDVLKDGRRTFENGFPRNANTAEVDTTAWGLVPRLQPIVNAFDNDPASRVLQDVGIDGFNDAGERVFFRNFVDSIGSTFGLNSPAYQKAFADPSTDNYHHFRGSNYDAAQLDILQRYKLFANYEGNSPAGNTVEPYPTIATNLPNTEDINFDNTLNQNEDYYEYRISLRPEDMVIGRNNINDIYVAPVRLRNGREEQVKWYQFRVPIMKPDLAVGNVIDFKSIRFMRMYLTNFTDSVVLRLATLQLVRTDWRRYIQSLAEPGEYTPIDNDETTQFSISTVNIEENGNRTPIPYVVPPGIVRQQNLFTTNFQQLNEQSLQLRFCNLRDGDSRAAFKNTSIDIRAYRRLRMFIHAEGNQLNNNDVNAFLRMGNDFTQNYYEYELPLQVTQPGTGDPRAIWPIANEIDVTFKEIIRAKQLRDQQNWPLNAPFVVFTPNGHKITVVGNPLLNNLRILMVGVRNPKKVGESAGDDGLDKCGEVWFNELRMTDFDNRGGWAATGLATVRMADFGTVNVSGTRRTIGWGSIESKPLERNREDAQMFDVSGTFELGKFFPQKFGVRLPMFVGYSESVSTPEFNPLQPDILLSDLLGIIDDVPKRDSILRLSQSLDRRRSINFTNVGKSRTGGTKKPKLWDIENLSATYAYSEIFQRNPFTEINRQQQYRGSLAYNYTTQPKFLKPLSWLGKSKLLNPITEINFNLIPSSLTLRADVDRVYQILQLRNNAEGGIGIPATFNKNFTINRFYNLRHDLTRSIKIEYDAINYARVDEPFGALDTEDKLDTVRQNFWRGGRTTKFTQNFNVNYNLPFAKIKMLDFVNASLRYGGSFDWIAAPLAAESLGNIISNTQTRQVNGQINFVGLYNKVDYLKRVNNNQPSKREEERLKRNQAAERERIKKEVERNQFGEIVNQKDVVVDDQKVNYVNNIARTLLKGVMMVKNVGVTYSENLNTTIPGFTPNSQHFGHNFDVNQPGLDFTFGNQRDLRQTIIRNNLITTDTNLNQPYLTGRSGNLNIRAQVEPYQDFKIELNVTKTQTQRMQDFIRAVSVDGISNVISTANVETGDYSISIISWRTAFEKIDNNPESDNYLRSQNFTNFENNRFMVARLLAAQNPNSNGEGLFDKDFPDGYSRKSPDVLIPAFLAAYTGNRITPNSLSPFPAIPMPNWRITYNGLTKVPFFKKYFQTITFNHSYRSTYTVSNFVTNLFYQEANGAPSNRDLLRTGDFVPKYQITMVTINEQLVPLLGIDATLKNSMTLRLEYKQTRSVSLSVINNRMTDMRNAEITIGIGYRLTNAKIPFVFNGKPLPNDLNIRFDFNIRDNQTLMRDIDGRDPLPSGGMRMLSIKPSIDYVVNDKVNIRFFFDRIVNTPYISNAFPTANSNGGISIRFTLAR